MLAANQQRACVALDDIGGFGMKEVGEIFQLLLSGLAREPIANKGFPYAAFLVQALG
jgi:hypothetical protein